MRAQCTRTIDETSDIFFDMVETMVSTGILVEYRQPARRISSAPL